MGHERGSRDLLDQRSDIVRLTAAAQALAAIETPTEAMSVMRLAEAARVYAPAGSPAPSASATGSRITISSRETSISPPS